MDIYNELIKIINIKIKNNIIYKDVDGYLLESIISELLEKKSMSINKLEEILNNNKNLFEIKPMYIDRKKIIKIKLIKNDKINFIIFQIDRKTNYINASKYCKIYDFNLYSWINEFSYLFEQANIDEPFKRFDNDIYIHPELMIYLSSTVCIDDCVEYIQILKEIKIYNSKNSDISSRKRKLNKTYDYIDYINEIYKCDLSSMFNEIDLKK
jgi:hypothetical protein